jgi:Icc-related predicted phosphoesterase
MKIFHISDTHGFHDQLHIPAGIDLLIHSGDCSNYRDPIKNETEVRDFIQWYAAIPVKYKIFVAGNHDTSIESRLVLPQDFESAGIIYLENESVTIEGIHIYGSPVTPNFHDWAFMKPLHKLNVVWSAIPEETDILIVHGPPKGILDLSYNAAHELEFCGCQALRTQILTRIQPKLVLFGHIHNREKILNAGTRQLSACDTIFSNGSVVTDGKFGTLSSQGNILEID